MVENSQGVATKLRSVGTINYSTGSVKVSDITITGLYGSTEFEFVFYPSSNDIIPSRQFIIVIPPNLMNVSIIPDTLAAGDKKANTNYIFTPSR